MVQRSDTARVRELAQIAIGTCPPNSVSAVGISALGRAVVQLADEIDQLWRELKDSEEFEPRRPRRDPDWEEAR